MGAIAIALSFGYSRESIFHSKGAATIEGESSSRRRKVNRAKLKRFAVIVCCLYLAVMMVRILFSQEQYKANQREDFASLERQLEEVKVQNEELERKIDFAKTNAYIERIARDQLGYVKKGEIKFVTGDVRAGALGADTQTDTTVPTPGEENE